MLENNIAIVISCMPAFATFLKQIVFETRFFKSLRTTLAYSGKGSQGSASHPRSFAGITFGGGNDKKARLKQRNGETLFDSYIELNDASQSRSYSTGQPTQEWNRHWKMENPAVPVTPRPRAASPDYSLPENGILRITEVDQDFGPVPPEIMKIRQ